MTPLKPFVVSERSMEPTLRPGDGLIAVRSKRARVGQIRCFEHPLRPGFWLVKRVGALDGDRFEACSDNRDPAAGASDSRRFGPVPVAGSYRVVLRVPAAWSRPSDRRRLRAAIALVATVGLLTGLLLRIRRR